MLPKVTLVSHTPDPMETIWLLWEQSKVDGPTPRSVQEVKDTVPQAKVEELFWQVLRQHIPIAEHIHFTFVLDGISISLREQMVRHRIGTAVGPNYGVDTIPDLASSSWWSQSMRIQDMSTFVDRGMYREPDWTSMSGLQGHVSKGPWAGQSVISVYRSTMEAIQEAYAALVACGVPMEDARELIPLGAQHSISWDLNLQSLLHILGKRGCWILQLGIWGPIIHGMVNELASRIHPMFARIVAPPCIDQDDHFKSCQYRLENIRRMPDDKGVVHDAHPPCPLWLCSDDHGRAALKEEFEHNDSHPGWREVARHNNYKEALINANDIVPRHHQMKMRAKEYEKLWLRDAYTWEPIK